MQEVFEKILERLEEEARFYNSASDVDQNIRSGVIIAKDIVQEEAEEYKNGWIPCSERLPEKNGMYICTQNSYDLATNKNIIRVSTELVEFYNGNWKRSRKNELIILRNNPNNKKHESAFLFFRFYDILII